MANTSKYQGPLTGLNVIDFGHYYAGPMVGMLLADQGANVIRIVKPGENESSSYYKELPEPQYRLLNRNKKLLELDLKIPAGKAQAKSLIERADVVIENFRPSVMKRLGLDYSSVKNKNPRLIYLSLPGFASTDKERAHIQAWEGVLAAAACLYTATHRYRQLLNFPPLYTWVPQCSAHGSMHGAVAIMAALVAREEHGCGTVIEVPLVDAGLSAVAHSIMHVNPNAKLPEMFEPFTYFPGDSHGAQLEKLDKGEALFNPSPFYIRPHICAENTKLVFCGVYEKHIEGFLDVLGINKILKQEGFVNEGIWETRLGNNLSGTLNVERKERLGQLIAERMLTKTAAEWETLLQSHNLPASLVRTRDQWLALEPMLQSGVLTRMEGKGLSALTVPGRVTDVSGSIGKNKTLADDYLDAVLITSAHADALVNDRTVQQPPQNTYLPLKKGDLLKGLKVLDLSNVMAGPTSTYNLAQYGAEVIRLEPPESVNGPGILPFILDIAQGKRSILTDIKTAPGREVFNRLIGWADVVVHNSVDDVAKRLGITQTQLQTINPKVLSCQISAFGGPQRGYWENRPGYDTLVQASSGLMVRYGSQEQPQDHGAISCGDVMCGVGLAFTALLAVYQQCKTGYAGEGRISLVRAMNFTQLPHMIAENGRSDWGEPHGQFAVGEHWWQRIYRCADDWIYVGASEDRANVLADTVAKETSADEQALEIAFAENDCAYWLKILSAVGIACHQVMKIVDLATQPSCSVSNDAADKTVDGPLEVFVRENHPCGNPLVFAAPTWVRIGENHSYKLLSTPPRLGENTIEILTELGYKDDEIKELIRLKIAHEYVPAMGSKNAYFFNPND